MEQALQTKALRKRIRFTENIKHIWRYAAPGLKKFPHFGVLPDFAILTRTLPTGMVSHSDRCGWFAVTGILILTGWAVMQLWFK